MTMQERKPSKTEVALRKMNEANRLQSSGGGLHHQLSAERLTTEANELLAPAACAVALGEVIPPGSESNFGIIDTLEDPNHVDSSAQEASENRLELLCELNALEAGLDCSNSIQASNSLEKMLAHQLAASHSVAMKLLARSMTSNMPPFEAARLSNAARSMMDCFQNGILTIQRLRTNGRQNILNQNIQLRDQAQAIIAGEFKRKYEE